MHLLLLFLNPLRQCEQNYLAANNFKPGEIILCGGGKSQQSLVLQLSQTSHPIRARTALLQWQSLQSLEVALRAMCKNEYLLVLSID